MMLKFNRLYCFVFPFSLDWCRCDLNWSSLGSLMRECVSNDCQHLLVVFSYPFLSFLPFFSILLSSFRMLERWIQIYAGLLGYHFPTLKFWIFLFGIRLGATLTHSSLFPLPWRPKHRNWVEKRKIFSFQSFVWMEDILTTLYKFIGWSRNRTWRKERKRTIFCLVFTHVRVAIRHELDDDEPNRVIHERVVLCKKEREKRRRWNKIQSTRKEEVWFQRMRMTNRV